MSLIDQLLEKQKEKFREAGFSGKESGEEAAANQAALQNGSSGFALSQGTSSVASRLSPVAKMILASDAHSSKELLVSSREALARALGVTVGDIEEVVSSVDESNGEGTWNALVVEERTRLALESAPMRANAWDRIESIALSKLGILVEQGRVVKASELLAIATAANRAHRFDGSGSSGGGKGNQEGNQQMPGVNVFVQQVTGAGSVESGAELQAGNLGTMKLSLSHKIQQQIAKQEPVDSAKVLMNSKMLDAKELRGLADKESIEDAEVIEGDGDE